MVCNLVEFNDNLTVLIMSLCTKMEKSLNVFRADFYSVVKYSRQILWEICNQVFNCPEQLNRWPCHSLSHSLTKDFTNCHTKNNPIDFRLPRHLIRVMRKHDLTNNLTIFDNFNHFWQFSQFWQSWNYWQFWQQKDNNSNKDNPVTCDIWDTD